MKTITKTLFAALAFVALQSHAQTQNTSGDTDWNAVLQEAQQRADANAAQGDQAVNGEDSSEQSEETDQADQADQSEQEPKTTQATLDEAKARGEANSSNQELNSEPTADEKFCGAVMCLSKGSPLPSQCKDPVNDYFKVRVYKRHTFKTAFDPAATSIKRDYKVKTECKWTPQKDRVKISAKYGMLERSPFLFN